MLGELLSFVFVKIAALIGSLNWYRNLLGVRTEDYRMWNRLGVTLTHSMT